MFLQFCIAGCRSVALGSFSSRRNGDSTNSLISTRDKSHRATLCGPISGMCQIPDIDTWQVHGSDPSYQRHYPTVLGIFCDNLAEMSRLLHLCRGVVLVFRPPPVPSSLSFFFLLNFILSFLVAALKANWLDHTSHLLNLRERPMNFCWEGMWGPAQRYTPERMSSGWLR